LSASQRVGITIASFCEQSLCTGDLLSVPEERLRSVEDGTSLTDISVLFRNPTASNR
jgi:hypothetical protein